MTQPRIARAAQSGPRAIPRDPRRTVRRFACATGLLAALTTPVAAEEPSVYQSTATTDAEDRVPEERAISEVTRADLDRRMPRSAPDALRYEPGVFVQQTAHAQGSAYLRGLTGQQTVLLFDGIRLNNATYRQGPNQYFFTVDSRTLASIEVMRGGGSTRFGSDALGGAIQANPIDPPGVDADQGWKLEPRWFLRSGTSDGEIGGRGQVAVAVKRPGFSIGVLAGVGARDVGLLRGPPVENLDKNTPLGRLPWVPRYASDRLTMLGTGFKEITGDGRVVISIADKHELTLAAYVVRISDAPRTDNCPAPTAPEGTCLTYENQFRHLAYVKYEGKLGRWAEELVATASFQQQYEKRRFDFPLQYTQLRGEDDVHTLGLSLRARTAVFHPRQDVGLRLLWGADNYSDWLTSNASIYYTDVMKSGGGQRGTFVPAAAYHAGGVWLDGEGRFGRRVVVRAGGRVGWAIAQAPADATFMTTAIDRAWTPVAGHAGIEVAATRWLSVLANVDHSFRAPNLDDMTGRQQTGPGFQFENPALSPEQATTFEAGARVRSRVVYADVWLYETLLHGSITRLLVGAGECPVDAPTCSSAWQRFYLVNAPALSELRGVEGSVKLRLPHNISLRATVAWNWGVGPRVGLPPAGLDVRLTDRVPLSRVPPVNGTVEAAWTHEIGVGLGAALRWAGPQTLLALADYEDARIPKYGTPGFAVVDLRASYRIGRRLAGGITVENLIDSPYRYHGSSVNGAGRSVVLQLEGALR